MRLWHQELLSQLSTKRLLSQHRECCALRGNGWGRKHKTVQYVFNHNYHYLICYHIEVMNEMEKRGFKYDEQWRHGVYRGRYCKPYPTAYPSDILPNLLNKSFNHQIIYPEHDDEYLLECIDILRRKGELLTIELDANTHNYQRLCTINIQHCYQIHIQCVDEKTIVIWTKEGGPYGN